MTPRIYEGTAGILKVHHVIDGDTFSATIVNWPSIIGRKIRIRLARIDCPEITSPNPKVRELAEAARLELFRRLTNAGRISISKCQRCKYFRVVGEVFADGINLSDYMVEAGHCWLSSAKNCRTSNLQHVDEALHRMAVKTPLAELEAFRILNEFAQSGTPPDELEWVFLQRSLKILMKKLEKRGKNLTMPPENI